LVRLDSDGKLIWEQIFGGPQNDSAWALTRVPNGNYLVTVATSSYGSGSKDAWILLLNQSGNLLWERIYGGDLWDRPTAVTIAANGSILLAGYTTSQGAGFEDYWLLRLDADGRL
jgi:hypothetical protein